MAKQKSNKITVDGTDITIVQTPERDYISLTDIAKQADDEPRFLIRNWLSTKNTISYLGVWETMHNNNFNRAGFRTVKNQFFKKSFSLTPKKWIEQTNGISLLSRSGRYGGGTYAHSDVAINFCYWLNPAFQVYFIKEFQRMKADEQLRIGDPFNIKRYLTSGNYSLLVSAIISQTDERLLTHPQPYKSRLPLAKEADMINKIVFGNTAREWRLHNTDKPVDRNQRDYANILDLIILNNLEFLDSMLLRWGLDQEERKNILQESYNFQYPILKESKTVAKLQRMSNNRKS